MMGWDNKQHQEESEVNHHHHHHHNHNIHNGANNVGIPYVKVMTDDQLETLRKQISVYATICEQLVEMHKNLNSHPDLPGVRFGNLYCDPLMTSVGQKITARQRWTPSPVQLQILESIFDQGNGTPSKQKIKDITSDLGQHGQISETNVYNWFQNRRARSKRKQQNPNAPGNTESEVEAEPEAEPESPKDKKTRPPEDFLVSHQNPAPRAAEQDICFQGSEMNSPDLHFFDAQANKAEPVFPSNGALRPVRNLAQMPFYDGLLSNPRGEHLGGKMEVGGPYSLYAQAEDYRMNG